MKITKLGLMGCCLALAMSASAFATTIAGWTFETSVPTTAGPLAAEIGSGSASGFHTASSTYSNPAGNGSTESYSSTAWAVGDYYQFTTSTVGYESITLTLDATSSGTGPRDFKVQTSTDGSTFADAGFSYSVLANASPNPTWNVTTASALYTVTTSLPASLSNQAAVYVRVTDNSTTSANGGTVAAGGTHRVDNVFIDGTAIPTVPEPTSIALVFASVGTLLFRRK